MFHGEGWIGEKFSNNVTFIKAKDCDFNKSNFNRELQKDDETAIATSEVQEVYMRYLPNYSHRFESEGYWIACEPGKGACLHYFAETGWKGGS